MKKINWLDHLVNLAVVIAGISIAFSLESWKESRSHRKIELQYAQSFIRDLDTDITDLDTLIKDDSLLLKALNFILKFDKNSQVGDTLYWALGKLGTFSNFKSHNTTFESLKSSGKFEEMWSLETRIQVIENYHSSYYGLLDIESYFKKNFDENILTYFIDESAFSSSQIQNTLLSRRFKNIVTTHTNFLRQKLSACLKSRQTSADLRNTFRKINGT